MDISQMIHIEDIAVQLYFSALYPYPWEMECEKQLKKEYKKPGMMSWQIRKNTDIERYYSDIKQNDPGAIVTPCYDDKVYIKVRCCTREIEKIYHGSKLNGESLYIISIFQSKEGKYWAYLLKEISNI